VECRLEKGTNSLVNKSAGSMDCIAGNTIDMDALEGTSTVAIVGSDKGTPLPTSSFTDSSALQVDRGLNNPADDTCSRSAADIADIFRSCSNADVDEISPLRDGMDGVPASHAFGSHQKLAL
jgi:hypothetical protein